MLSLETINTFNKSSVEELKKLEDTLEESKSDSDLDTHVLREMTVCIRQIINNKLKPNVGTKS